MNDRDTERTVDEAAQRILNLMFIFNTAARPLSTSEIISDSDLGYGSANASSDEKKFRRDRETLEGYGFHIRAVRPEGANRNEEVRWELDRKTTFATTGLITSDDADTLCEAIDTCVAMTSPTLARPLRHIRDKVAECGSVTRVPDREGEAPTATEEAVWTAFTERKALNFTYVNYHGVEKKRRVKVYGMFTQGGITYFTGLDSDSGTIRTFRADRIVKALKPKDPYRIPADFRIEEYMFLPFDLSEGDPVDVTFSLPATLPDSEVKALCRHRGEIEETGDGTLLWRVTAKDIDAAARFALGHAAAGMRPVAPQALIDSWNHAIAKAVSTDGEE